MRDSAKWEYEDTQNAREQSTKLAVAALGNESTDTAARAKTIETLGGFALNIWDRVDQANKDR